jgi:amino acid permease
MEKILIALLVNVCFFVFVAIKNGDIGQGASLALVFLVGYGLYSLVSDIIDWIDRENKKDKNV